MHAFSREPALEDMLSDPIVLALMRADGLDRSSLYALLETLREPHHRDAERGMLCECGPA